MSDEQKPPALPDGSGDIFVFVFAIVAGFAIVTALGLVGIFYPPTWGLLHCLIGHLGGTVSQSCI